MGQIRSTRIAALIIFFIITSAFVYLQPSSKVGTKQMSLQGALSNIENWKSSETITLKKGMVESLKLDGYINTKFSNGSKAVELYIGYYLTTKKLGALHDPLVCFPGQGWEVSHINKGRFEVQTKKELAINYSSFVAQQGPKKVFILYWFQSYDKTNSNTFFQKIESLWLKAMGFKEDNAFVRITTRVGNNSISECHKTIFSFVTYFYPAFLDYIREDSS